MVDASPLISSWWLVTRRPSDVYSGSYSPETNLKEILPFFVAYKFNC